ncbi:MAG: hypothetical protein OEW15_13955 [Nitrospirota bacterium]|nr:hypothetical protein [Nitrospirota bacterium]
MGVFLAANAAFEKAVLFELTKADLNARDLLVSLEAEVLDNAAALDQYIARFKKGGKKFSYSPKTEMRSLICSSGRE